MTVAVSHGDDLDMIVDSKLPAETRGQAYDRLASADFSAIAAKLATLIGTHPIMTGLGARTRQPWSEPQLSEGDRIGCTLYQLWSHHIEAARMRGRNIGLMLTLVEEPSIGGARYLAIMEVASSLHSERTSPDKSLPPLENILTRLDRLARDAKQPNDLRRSLVKILFEHGDPNQYLDLATELSATQTTPLQQSEAFRNCTPAGPSTKFTKANRKKYLRHCYELLEKFDDGRSGAGYFLAIHIGHFLGIPPVRELQGPFVPDQRLPIYQGPHGLSESFFQDTVNNARKWWNENQAQY